MTASPSRRESRVWVRSDVAICLQPGVDGVGDELVERRLAVDTACVALEEQPLERAQRRIAEVGPRSLTQSAGGPSSATSSRAWRASTSSTTATINASRDPKWWMSMRWLVPTSLGDVRSDRRPTPGRRTSRRRQRATRRGGRRHAVVTTASTRCFSPAPSIARYRRVNRTTNRPTSEPTIPVCSMICSTRVVESSNRCSPWVADVIAPGDLDTHVHDAPGSTSVTSQTSLGNRGCLIRTRVPRATPVPAITLTSVIDSVQSGHRSPP